MLARKCCSTTTGVGLDRSSRTGQASSFFGMFKQMQQVMAVHEGLRWSLMSGR